MAVKSLVMSAALWICATGYALAASLSSVSATYDVYKGSLRIGQI
jgi:hypothetical protein